MVSLPPFALKKSTLIGPFVALQGSKISAMNENLYYFNRLNAKLL